MWSGNFPVVSQPGLKTKDVVEIKAPLSNDSHLQLGLVTYINTPPHHPNRGVSPPPGLVKAEDREGD